MLHSKVHYRVGLILRYNVKLPVVRKCRLVLLPWLACLSMKNLCLNDTLTRLRLSLTLIIVYIGEISARLYPVCTAWRVSLVPDVLQSALVWRRHIPVTLNLIWFIIDIRLYECGSWALGFLVSHHQGLSFLNDSMVLLQWHKFWVSSPSCLYHFDCGLRLITARELKLKWSWSEPPSISWLNDLFF